MPGPYAPPIGAPAPALPISPAGSVLDASLVMGSWQLWWEYNREDLLDLRPRLSGGMALTGSDDFFLGHGAAPALAQRFRPSQEDVRDLVLPALLGALRSDGGPDLTASAALASARVGAELSGAPRAEVDSALRGLLGHANQRVAESGLLGLGVLGHEPTAVLLREVLGDTPDGRAALGGSGVSERRRALAAFALGLLGERSSREDVRRFCAGALFDAFAAEDLASQDLPVACVVALGQIPLRADANANALLAEQAPPPASSRLAAARALLALLDERDLGDLARAHIPGSVARLVEGLDGTAGGAGRRLLVDAARPLLEPTSRVPNDVARGAAVALGLVAGASGADLDHDARHALKRAAENHGDASTRHFAAISLAFSASRPGPGPDGRVGARESQRTLEKLLRHGRAADRPWVLLSMGVLGRSLLGPSAGVGGADALAQDVRERVEKGRVVDEVAAACLAVGLAGDLAGADVVEECRAEARNDEVRGRSVVGLALLGDQRAAGPALGLMQEGAYRPALLREASVARALLGDARLVPDLLEFLSSSGSEPTQESIARALGLVCDARSLAPLAELVRDPGTSDFVRAHAVAALGMAAERAPRPWQARLVRGLNYPASTPTLQAVLDAGHWSSLGAPPIGW